MPRCCVILNPTSGAGSSERRWLRAEGAFKGVVEAAGYELDVLRTAAPGDASALARNTIEEGADVIVAAGGDGLLNEVVTGFMESRAAGGSGGGGAGAGGGAPARARLAVLPLGTGNDFCKTHGWESGDATAAARRVAGGKTEPLDVGCLQLLGPEEAALREASHIPPPAACGARGGCAGAARPAARYFCNIASCGVGASAARRVQKLKRWPLAYEIAAVSALLAWRPPTGWECSVDGGGWAAVPDPTVLAVGNGRFWGGGFQICPKASTSSGRMEGTILQSYGVGGFLSKGGLLRAGKFLHLPGVTTHKVASHLALRPAAPVAAGESGAPVAGAGTGAAAAARWLPWEVDGEAAGEGAAVVGFVPGAIQLCV